MVVSPLGDEVSVVWCHHSQYIHTRQNKDLEQDVPWKTRAVKFRLAEWQRLRGVWGGAVAMSDRVGVMGSSEVGGGVWVPERGVLLGMGLVEFSLPLPLPCSVLVLCQQRVEALPPPWHRPPLA